LNSGTGTDVVNVEATGGPTNVNTGGGSNTNTVNSAAWPRHDRRYRR